MSDSPENRQNVKTSIQQGLAAAWTICLGYIAIAIGLSVGARI